MLSSLLTRAVRASFAGTLVFSLGLAPAFARMGGAPGAGRGAHFGMAFFHGHSFGMRGLNHNGFNQRFFDGRKRFFDGRGRFARNDFKRRNFNQGALFGCCDWGGWGGFSAPTDPAAPIIVGGGGPPVVINVSPAGVAGEAGGGYEGACVIHQLNFDGAGKYIGERQYPQC